LYSPRQTGSRAEAKEDFNLDFNLEQPKEPVEQGLDNQQTRFDA
jgi:hypothetical protein